MTQITDLITSLGFDTTAETIENAHGMGKKRNDKQRRIIIRLYSRPFNNYKQQRVRMERQYYKR